MADRPILPLELRERVSAALGGQPVPGPLWEVVLAMVCVPDGEPATLRWIARELGISSERVGALVRDAPASLVERTRARADGNAARDTRWRVRLADGEVVDVEAMSRELEIFRGRRDAHRRRRIRSAAERALEATARAHEALVRGDFAGVARLVADHELSPHRLLPGISPRQRGRVAVALGMLRGELAMARGDAAEALAILDRAAHLATRDVAAALPELHATRGAALRMLGAHAWPCAEAAFDLGLSAVPLAPRDQQVHLRRWLSAARSTPRTLIGDLSGSAATLGAALEDITDPAGEAETLLLLARLHLAGGAPERAQDMVARADRFFSELPRWLRAWVDRYRADVLAAEPFAGSRAEAYARAWAAAWSANDGYGFQRRLLAARLATVGAELDLEGYLSTRVYRSVRLYLGALLPAARVRADGCLPLSALARRALGIAGRELPRFYW